MKCFFSPSNNRGQALLEYLMIFSVMALIGVNLIKALNSFMGGTIGSLGYILTKQLSSGVCEANCWSLGYLN